MRKSISISSICKRQRNDGSISSLSWKRSTLVSSHDGRRRNNGSISSSSGSFVFAVASGVAVLVGVVFDVAYPCLFLLLAILFSAD
ncbi:hypothetical protein QYF36_007881 [Acer negundo]|nr:hypothetical protein QYF36_007881 [Acer negundo]